MKIYEAEFKPIYPIGGCLIIAANDVEEAMEIAKKTVNHTEIENIIEILIDKPKVIIYMDGNY